MKNDNKGQSRLERIFKTAASRVGTISRLQYFENLSGFLPLTKFQLSTEGILFSHDNCNSIHRQSLLALILWIPMLEGN